MKDEQAETTIKLVRPYGTLALANAMFLGCALFFSNRAHENDRGLVLNGIIHMDAGGADVFYAVLALLSLGMTFAGVLGLYSLKRRTHFRIRLTNRTLTLPYHRVWNSRDVELRYDEIAQVRLHPPAAPQWIVVDTLAGAHYTISGRVLPPDWPITVLASTLVERWRAHLNSE